MGDEVNHLGNFMDGYMPEHYDDNAPLVNKKTEDKNPGFCQKYCFFLTIDWWRKYFDFDQEIIGSRLKGSLNPFKYALVKEVKENGADVYGPFWICFTLAFCVANFGNLAKYIDNKNWSYDFGYFSGAYGLVYAFAILAP